MGHDQSRHHRGHPCHRHRGGRGRGRGRHRHHRHFQDGYLHQQAAELQVANAELVAQLQELSERLDANEHRNEPHNVDEAAALIMLAGEIEALPMHARSFGFFGRTSAGKSSIINKLYGTDVAEVGAGETTTEITSYEGRDYTLCDIPGLNDQMSYFTMEYIQFWKGLTRRLVVITTTVREMLKVLRLFDGIGLDYDIIVNKLDAVDAGERDQLKETIRREVRDLGLKNAKQIWFVSAKNPDQFPDWLTMINHFLNH